MKTRMISLLVMLVALLSCEESLQVEGPKIPDTDKTVTVILSNIPAGFTGGTVYLFTLDNKGKVYAIHEAEATEGAIVQVAPVAGFSAFDIAAFIPTSADEWSSKTPFTDGHYSRTTAVNDREGVFVTQTWTTTTTLSSAPATGLARSIQAELYVNGLANPVDTDFTKGEIITLDAAVADNIKSGIASVEYFLDGTELQSYTAKPYKFQFNTVDVAKGNHWLYVKAVNAAGHESQDSLRIYVSDVDGNVGPSVQFFIGNGSEFERQQLVTINANASDPDDGLDHVEFKINGVMVGSDDTAPYSYLWDTYDNEAGAVVLEITAFDKSGQSRSDVVNVTLVAPQNYAPRAAITSPTHGATFAVGTASINLAATATDPEGDAINRVEFRYRNAESAFSTYIGQDTTSPYAFTFNTAALPAGTYYIFATAFDNNGNSSYESVTITIE